MIGWATFNQRVSGSIPDGLTKKKQSLRPQMLIGTKGVFLLWGNAWGNRLPERAGFLHHVI